DVVVGGVDLILEAVATADALPHPLTDAASVANGARPTPRAVVLKPHADVIRMPHVRRGVVAEAHRPEAQRLPLLAAVPGDVDAAVVAVHHVLAVERIDPDGVIVDVAHVI